MEDPNLLQSEKPASLIQKFQSLDITNGISSPPVMTGLWNFRKIKPLNFIAASLPPCSRLVILEADYWQIKSRTTWLLYSFQLPVHPIQIDPGYLWRGLFDYRNNPATLLSFGDVVFKSKATRLLAQTSVIWSKETMQGLLRWNRVKGFRWVVCWLLRSIHRACKGLANHPYPLTKAIRSIYSCDQHKPVSKLRRDRWQSTEGEPCVGLLNNRLPSYYRQMN